MTTGPKTVDVELTHDEFVCILAGARPDSSLMTRLKAASRLQRHKAFGFGSIYFGFTGTEAETYALLELATARAPGAVTRIRQGLRLARDKAKA